MAGQSVVDKWLNSKLLNSETAEGTFFNLQNCCGYIFILSPINLLYDLVLSTYIIHIYLFLKNVPSYKFRTYMLY